MSLGQHGSQRSCKISKSKKKLKTTAPTEERGSEKGASKTRLGQRKRMKGGGKVGGMRSPAAHLLPLEILWIFESAHGRDLYVFDKTGSSEF